MWDALRWWIGTPSMAMVARRAMLAIEAQGATDIAFDARGAAIRYRVAGTGAVMSLANVFADVLHAPRRHRDQVVRRFVQAVVLPQTHQPPASYADARERLLPIVRTRSDDAFAVLGAGRFTEAGNPGEIRMAARPIAGELIAGIACDSPHAMQRITAEQLARWGVSLGTALDDALQNLRALPEHGGWRALGDGVWSGEWGDSYESSRALLPDLIHRLGVPDPVALLPLRHVLLVTSARNEAGLAAMARGARELIERNTRWLSLQPIALAGATWQAFEPPASVKPAFDDLQCIEQASTYAEQATLLEELHERRGQDIFVANVTLMQHQEGGRLASYGVWSEGVDTLLPRTHLIVFHRPGVGDARELLAVRWTDAVDIAGALMTPTDLEPPRWRVTAFPDAARWARLKAVEAQMPTA